MNVGAEGEKIGVVVGGVGVVVAGGVDVFCFSCRPLRRSCHISCKSCFLWRRYIVVVLLLLLLLWLLNFSLLLGVKIGDAGERVIELCLCDVGVLV